MFGDKRQQRGKRREFSNDSLGVQLQNRDRQPLIWEELETFTNGRVQGKVSSAKSDRGQTLYSFEVFKPGREGRPPKKHFDSRDIMSLKSIISEIEVWIENDRVEHTSSCVA